MKWYREDFDIMPEESFDIVHFLKSAVATGASDEHLKVGHSPFLRKNGFIKKTNIAPLTEEDMDKAVMEIAPSALKKDILSKMDVDFMFELKGCSRFRVNYNRQLGHAGLVIRNINYVIPELKELELPDILGSIVNYQNGIILVTGPTGSGKSTTIASLINQINSNASKHIVTIEDPVEYVFSCKKSIVTQRQVGVDTDNFSDGIKYALRQDPDVIFIGEIRDKETMEAALKASETGHLVLSTLHTNDAVQTINRVVNMFDVSDRDNMRCQFAEVLRGTIAQKLVYSKEHDRRYAAQEVMVATPTVRDYILKDNIDKIYDLLAEGGINNMISMNKSLINLVEEKKISQEEAMIASNDPDALAKVFRGAY